MAHVTWSPATERGLTVVSRPATRSGKFFLGEMDPGAISQVIVKKLTASFEAEMEARLVLKVAITIAGQVVKSAMIGAAVGLAATGIGAIVSVVIIAIEEGLKFAQAKWDAKVKERVGEYQDWSKQEISRFCERVMAIKQDGIKQMFSSGIRNYLALRMSGVDNVAQLAAVDDRWAAVVADNNQTASLGLVVDMIDNRNYVGLADVRDQYGRHCGTVWYDGRMVQAQGLGDFWSKAKDVAVKSWHSVYDSGAAVLNRVSGTIINYIPKIAKLVQAPIHYIAAPAMKAVGWEGTAQKLDNGTLRATNVAVAAYLSPMLAVVNPVGAGALVVGQAAGALSQTAKDLTGSNKLVDKMEWVDRKSDSYARDVKAPGKDVENTANMLIGRDAFLTADRECKKGVIQTYEWMGAKEAEVKKLYGNQEFLTKGADGITYHMLSDPGYAESVLAMVGIDPSLARQSLVPQAPAVDSAQPSSASVPAAPIPPAAVAIEHVDQILGPGVKKSGGFWGTAAMVGGSALILGPAAIIPAAAVGIALASKKSKV